MGPGSLNGTSTCSWLGVLDRIGGVEPPPNVTLTLDVSNFRDAVEEIVSVLPTAALLEDSAPLKVRGSTITITESGLAPVLEAMIHGAPPPTARILARTRVAGTGWNVGSIATVAAAASQLEKVMACSRGVIRTSTTCAVTLAESPCVRVSVAKSKITLSGVPTPSAVGSFLHAASAARIASAPEMRVLMRSSRVGLSGRPQNR